MLYLLLCVLPVVLIFVLFYSNITLALCNWSGHIIASVTGEPIDILRGEFLPWFGNTYYLDVEGSDPSFFHACVSAVICFAAIIILGRINNNARPFLIYLCMGFIVQLISSLFFLFVPQLFPYTLTDYSDLYMKQQVALWIMISLIAGLATGLLDPAGLSKFVAFFTTVAYLFVYGCLRYVLYLIALRYFSLMYMASLFFTLGVLFDFLQLVAIYAVFAKHVSAKMGAGRGYAKWLWS
jgi:hypothetical protein